MHTHELNPVAKLIQRPQKTRLDERSQLWREVELLSVNVDSHSLPLRIFKLHRAGQCSKRQVADWRLPFRYALKPRRSRRNANFQTETPDCLRRILGQRLTGYTASDS